MTDSTLSYSDTELLALVHDEDHDAAHATLSGARWTLRQLAEAPLSPWIIRRILIEIATRSLETALVVTRWAALCVSEVADEHARARLRGAKLDEARERSLGSAGVYLARAVRGIEPCGDRVVIAHAQHSAREWARLAAEHAAAAQHPDGAASGDDATARDHLRRLAQMIDPNGSIPWGGITLPDRIGDMTDEERAADARLTVASRIGASLSDDDAYHVVLFGWGPDDEIPYGRVVIAGVSGRRYIPIDHGTALVRRETAQVEDAGADSAADWYVTVDYICGAGCHDAGRKGSAVHRVIADTTIAALEAVVARIREQGVEPRSLTISGIVPEGCERVIVNVDEGGNEVAECIAPHGAGGSWIVLGGPAAAPVQGATLDAPRGS